eukprot:Filipodium_phascolosomae@DN3194_c0_g1_i1.p1
MVSTTSPDADLSDVQKITRFSRLNIEISELRREVALLDSELSNLKDAQDEASMIFEPDAVMIRRGDFFYMADDSTVSEFVEQRREKKELEKSNKNQLMKIIQDEMDELKQYLYNKFENAINLDV